MEVRFSYRPELQLTAISFHTMPTEMRPIRELLSLLFLRLERSSPEIWSSPQVREQSQMPESLLALIKVNGGHSQPEPGQQVFHQVREKPPFLACTSSIGGHSARSTTRSSQLTPLVQLMTWDSWIAPAPLFVILAIPQPRQTSLEPARTN